MEEVAGAAEIKNGKEGFVGIRTQARSASDDLLELGHGTDVAVQNDELHAFGVRAGGEQFARGHDNRVRAVHADEVLVQAAAFLVVGGHAHGVLVVLGHEVAVAVAYGVAHIGRVPLSGTEDDGFGHAPKVLEVTGDDLGHLAGATANLQRFVELVERVAADGDGIAFHVHFAFFRLPAVDVFVEVDGHDLIRRKEAVFDALLQRVGDERIAEVIEVVGTVFFVGRGSHADLDSGLEVFEDVAPTALFIGTAAMTLVHNDKVEVIARNLPEVVGHGFGVVALELLVQAEINLVILVDDAFLDFRGRVERREVVHKRLINELVAVGKVEHVPHHACLSQTPDNLKSGVRLARAGGHDQQGAPAMLANYGVDSAVDGLHLVVARRMAFRRGVVERFVQRFGIFVRDVVELAPARPELGRRGEFVERKFPLFAGRNLEFKETFPGGSIGERHVEHLGVGNGLIDAIPCGFCAFLGLDHGKRPIDATAEYIVGLGAAGLRLFDGAVLPRHDAVTVSLEGILHQYLIRLPTGALDRRSYAAQLGIFFRLMESFLRGHTKLHRDMNLFSTLILG